MPTTFASLAVAWRLLRLRPGLALARLATVVLVVAAGSAVFAVANVTLLRPLPFTDGDRLVRVYLQPAGTTSFASAVPLYPIVFQRLHERQQVLEDLQGIWLLERAVAGDAEAESLPSGRVSGGFFAMFSAYPRLGRLITHTDVDTGAKVVVLSHALWQQRYGGAADVVGRTLVIDREAHEIIGVTTQDFEPEFTISSFWTPLALRQPADFVALSSVRAIGRARPGAAMERVQESLAQTMQSFRDEAPALIDTMHVGVIDLREAQFGSRRPALLMLLVAVCALAVIAIANLANLTLADVVSRQTDFAVRAALGGTRRALVLPELMQAVILAVGGSGVGLAAGLGLAATILALDPSSALAGVVPVLDWRVAVWSIVLGLVILLMAVVLPVWRMTTGILAGGIASGATRVSGARTNRRVRQALVFAQMTLGIVVLSSGALVATALRDSQSADIGFDPSNVLTAQLRLPAHIYPSPTDRATFVDQLLERVRATPGVVDAGTTLNPFTTGGGYTTGVRVESQTLLGGEFDSVQYRRISPGYLSTMRIRLLEGRDFTRQDWVGSHQVAIVSRSFAQRYWPEGKAIGRRLRRGIATVSWLEVVGVVDDVRDAGLGDSVADTLYTPYYQANGAATPVALVVRTRVTASTMVGALKATVRDVDPMQPLSNIVRVDEFLSASLGPQRFRVALVALCGLIGLVLATLGTYAITTRAVLEQRREVGIRLALGGRPVRVWWTVAAGSIRAVWAGAALGGLGAVLAARGLATLLPELNGAGWQFSLWSGAAMLTAGVVAALVAARSVIRLEPSGALRAVAAGL